MRNGLFIIGTMILAFVIGIAIAIPVNHDVKCVACNEVVNINDAQDYNAGDKTVWYCNDCISNGELVNWWRYL